MHCKHCGNSIDNDSKYCAHCGGQVEPISQIPDKKDLTDIDPVQGDLGLIIAFCIMVGMRIFWYLIRAIEDNSSAETVDIYRKVFMKPSYVIFWSVPLILAVFMKYKELRRILLVVGSVILAMAVYDHFLKGL
jgi:hypothetical protein